MIADRRLNSRNRPIMSSNMSRQYSDAEKKDYQANDDAYSKACRKIRDRFEKLTAKEIERHSRVIKKLEEDDERAAEAEAKAQHNEGEQRVWEKYNSATTAA